jgi:hypothetical protein
MVYRRRHVDLVSLFFVLGMLFANSLTPVAHPGLASQETGRISSGQDGRMRPPVAVTCDRNNLTSYAGKVIKYSRRAGLITMTVETDWDTTEVVTLRHPRNSNASKWFLFRGKTFRNSDWKKIESSHGQLHPNMRVTAWICNDGRRPIIDWQPSRGNEYAPPSTP